MKVSACVFIALVVLLCGTNGSAFGDQAIPHAATKFLAKLSRVRTVRMRFETFKHSLEQVTLTRDTFDLVATGLDSSSPLKAFISSADGRSCYDGSVYVSLHDGAQPEVFYDTLSCTEFTRRYSWKLFRPLVTGAEGVRNVLRHEYRSFDTIVSGRPVHAIEGSIAVEGPADSMMGPVVLTYYFDDDSNMVAYSSYQSAFHSSVMNGAVTLAASYSTHVLSDVDRRIRGLKKEIAIHHYPAMKHTTMATARMSLPNVGEELAISGVDRDGRSVAIANVRSKVKLLDFWYASCGPCRYAIPFLRSLSAKYRDSGLSVIGLDPFDKDPKIIEHVAETESLTNPELLIDRSVADELGVEVYPTFILLDAENRVLHTTVGYAKDVEAAFERSLRTALGLH